MKTRYIVTSLVPYHPLRNERDKNGCLSIHLRTGITLKFTEQELKQFIANAQEMLATKPTHEN